MLLWGNISFILKLNKLLFNYKLQSQEMVKSQQCQYKHNSQNYFLDFLSDENLQTKNETKIKF